MTDNPFDVVWGNMSWGHATSPDLYHWTNQPIAIVPDNSTHGIFTGSVVVDSENTSGFFPDQDNGVVAIYTLHTPEVETQDIAYSHDGGRTFTKYENNPVINIGAPEFRDPHVRWHSDISKWVMAVAYPDDLVIGFYTSPNLKDWTHSSNFSQPMPGKQVECPNLVRFDVEGGQKDVLFISINPGAPLGGSITGYFVGHWDGHRFTADHDDYIILDFAKDYYAAQWFAPIPGKSPISIAWASNWQYAGDVPPGKLEGFRGIQTPRVNALKKNVDGVWIVTSNPVDDLQSVKGHHMSSQSAHTGSMTVDFSDIKSNAIKYDVRVVGLDDCEISGDVSFNFTSPESGEFFEGGIHLGTREFWLNRAGTRLYTTADNPNFTPTFDTTVPPFEHGKFGFSGVFDRSILETFLDDGDQVATTRFYSKSPLTVLTVSADELCQGAVVQLKAWALESGWGS